MLTNNQYSPTSSTSKRKRDAFDFNNFEIARTVESDFKKARSLSFETKRTLPTLDINNCSPNSSSFKSTLFGSFNSPPSSPYKSNHFGPLNGHSSSPFKQVNTQTTGFYSFDDNKLLEWIPKSRRKQHLASSKSDRIFTKEDLRIILENAIKETRHNHSILCDKELHIRLGEQQGTFEKIYEKESNNNIHNNYNNHNIIMQNNLNYINNNNNNIRHNNNTINNSHNRNNHNNHNNINNNYNNSHNNNTINSHNRNNSYMDYMS